MNTPAPPKPATRRWPRVVLGVAVFALIAVLAARTLDVPRLLAALSKVAPWHLAVILGVAILHVTARALRYHALVRYAEPNASYGVGAGVRIFLAGLGAASVTPARAGDLVKAKLVQRYGISLPTGLGLVVVERMLDLLVVAGSIVGAGAYLAGNTTTDAWRRASFVFAGILVLTALAFSVRRLRDGLAAVLFAVLARTVGPHPRVDALRLQVAQLFASWDLVFGVPRRLALIVPTSTVAWLLDFAKLWLVLRFLDVPVPWLVVCFVYPVSLVAGILSMVPFSEGVVGLTGVTLLVAMANVDSTTATLAFTLDRSISVLTPLALWGLSALVRPPPATS